MRHHGNFENMEEYPPLLKINQAFLNGRECDVSQVYKGRLRTTLFPDSRFFLGSRKSCRQTMRR